MLSIVVAAENKRGIGYQGRIPWHIPGDLKNFKRLTLYNAVIMGRNTWISIGRALPDRLNIVVSDRARCEWHACGEVSLGSARLGQKISSLPVCYRRRKTFS